MTSERSAEPRESGRGRSLVPTIVLLVWVALAGALLLLSAPPPEPPAVDPQDQAIRERMSAWAVEDAEVWQEDSGDLRIPWAEASGHLAIVIDDVGRELHSFDKLHALRYPLSFSILPGSVYATGVQDRLLADDRRPREVLLHLPMEPLDPEHMRADVESREQFLVAADDAGALQRKLEDALARVPTAVGVNNHMGSRLTTDARAMAAIMPTLRARGLYYLDSRTTPETVAAITAARAGVPTVSRKVFLDHEPGQAAIRSALLQAAEYARDQPTVAIAHPSMDVVEVLEQVLPELHAQGIGLYTVSQIVAAESRVD